MEKSPSYEGLGLVNLVAEIERRLTGSSVFSPLSDSSAVPDAHTIVLVLFDGLGVAQLEHPSAQPFRDSMAGTLQAGFPSTTSVSLATIATGLPPSQHGQVAHLTWYPDLQEVVNTLKWVTINGEHVPYDYASLLPAPNLWERLRDSGVEPVTVQPGDFSGSALTRALYRGARFEGVWDPFELADATIALAAEPRRLVFTYVPFVDVAGHVTGQGSDEFDVAIRTAAIIWERLLSALPTGVALLGTADHGLIDIAEGSKLLVREPEYRSVRFAGDPRGVHLWGDAELIASLTRQTGGTLIDPIPMIGPDPTTVSLSHLGDRLLLAPRGKAIIPRGFDKRLHCYHGGLTPEEIDIPLLVG
jgi:hypothetical protein